MMRAIWTDRDGDEIEVESSGVDGEFLSIGIGEEYVLLNADDAESFAAYLRAWALKQREGV
jgi:hypothetical protein